MFKQGRYTIPFRELRVGSHHLTWTYDDALFAVYPESEIQKGEGEIDVELIKHANLLEFNISIGGNVEVMCDRCLDSFSMPIYYSDTVIVKFSEDDVADDSEYIWVSPDDNEIDLQQYIYESICLSLPYQRVHPDMSECNQEMLAKFKIVSGEEFDLMYTETPNEQTDENDSWKSSLEKLKDKLNKK